MSEHRRYQHPAPAEKPRAKEWVTLEGGDVCVWALTVMEIMNLLEKASRPVIQGAPKEFSGGVDSQEELLWKIILSTYESDEPGAKLVWSGDQESLRQVFSLSLSEFTALAAAIQRVNGADPERIEALEAFTVPSEAGKASPSLLSASANSTAAPKR
jgi:hypothetical protein